MTADRRIAELLQAGYSVDFAAEEGVHGGWTRLDVLRVASERGWELDPSGRIPRPQRLAPKPPAVLRPGRVLDENSPPAPPRPARLTPAAAPSQPATPPRTPATTSGATVDPVKEKISAALRSENTPIRKAAEKANAALASLDRLLAEWESKELARQRVVELEQQLAEAKAALRGSTPGTAKPTASGEHAQARAWAREQGIPVTAIGRVATDVLEAWRKATGSAA